jgi:NAD(P)-dependent dehydrogenase (short-subunit alcohol dehydrogenase family)
MRDLRGKVAVVTGASRGSGLGIARVLGEAGATVYVTGRSVEGGPRTEDLPGTIEETARAVAERGGRAVAVRCDHTRDSEVEALFERVKREQGRLDLLVNNVWGGYEKYSEAPFNAPFWEQPLWRWEAMFAAGVRAHYTASWYGAPLMIAGRQGLIINISAGDRGQYLGSLVYDVAKAAIDRLATGLAVELRPYNIAAVSLYPGFMRTERVLSAFQVDPALAYHADSEMWESHAGLRITESPEYVGRAVVALATDPNVIEKTGRVLKTGDLAREYSFTDIDGRQVPPFVFPDAS